MLVVGGSAGGVEAAVELVAGLPRDLPACVLVTLHIGRHARSRLPQILDRAGPLAAEHARDGTELRPGRILVAPPDRHLLVVDGRARLSSGPRINRHRPAVDALFASAARWAGTGVTAVVLSGMLDDGAVGALLVARAGGRVLAQDPCEALFPSMPRAAIAAVPGTGMGRARELGALVEFTSEPEAGKEHHVPEPFYDSADVGHLSPDESRLTRLACPDCGGGLAEIDLGGISYYRCHVGHQFSPQALEAAQRESAEAKLWAATAALEEHAVHARQLEREQGPDPFDDYGLVADRSAATARALRRYLDARTDPLRG